MRRRRPSRATAVLLGICLILAALACGAMSKAGSDEPIASPVVQLEAEPTAETDKDGSDELVVPASATVVAPHPVVATASVHDHRILARVSTPPVPPPER